MYSSRTVHQEHTVLKNTTYFTINDHESLALLFAEEQKTSEATVGGNG